jgi:hypothetical protein
VRPNGSSPDFINSWHTTWCLMWDRRSEPERDRLPCGCEQDNRGLSRATFSIVAHAFKG